MLCFHQTSDAPSLLESLTGIKISICLQGGQLGTCGPHAEWVLAPGFWGRQRFQLQTSHQALSKKLESHPRNCGDQARHPPISI